MIPDHSKVLINNLATKQMMGNVLTEDEMMCYNAGLNALKAEFEYLEYLFRSEHETGKTTNKSSSEDTSPKTD